MVRSWNNGVRCMSFYILIDMWISTTHSELIHFAFVVFGLSAFLCIEIVAEFVHHIIGDIKLTSQGWIGTHTHTKHSHATIALVATIALRRVSSIGQIKIRNWGQSYSSPLEILLLTIKFLLACKSLHLLSISPMWIIQNIMNIRRIWTMLIHDDDAANNSNVFANNL